MIRQILRHSAVPPLGLLLLALLPAIGGCSRTDSASFDFAANLDLATVHPETRIVNVGRSEARRSLIGGWSFDEVWDDDWSFAWGLWPESTLSFYAYEPRSTVIRFRCRPSEAMVDAEPAVELLVNGEPVATVVLQPGFNDYQVRVRRRQLRTGRNELTLRYGHGGKDGPWSDDELRPSLAVAWQRFRFGERFPYGQASSNGASLEIPFRSRVDYFLQVEPGARLGWEQVVPWDAATGSAGHTLRVEVLYESEQTPANSVEVEDADFSAPTSIVLDGSGLARVSFLALPAQGTPERPSGLRIVRPTLSGAASESPPTDPGRGAATDRQVDNDDPTARGATRGSPSALMSQLRESLPDGRPPNIVVYLVDTLRADHLATYGYPRPTSPKLDALSAESVVFEHAVAQSGWTRTSVASILTGLQPRAHSVLDRDDALSADAVTLPAILGDRGYQTHAVITNGNVAPQLGFDNGFDSFVYAGEQVGSETIHQLSDRVNEAFFAWLDERQTDRPFFAYLHTSDPHTPYTPRDPYRARFLRDPRLARLSDPDLIPDAFERFPDLSVADAVGGLSDLYDAEIAYNDEQFGRLLDRLRATDNYDSTLILFVSDHGEEFFEHGAFEHGRTLLSEIIFVPLVIKFPHGWAAGTRVDTPVQHVDILPTILDLIDAPPVRDASGDSLLPIIWAVIEGTGEESTAERSLMSYLELDQRRTDSLLTDDRHVVRWHASSPAADPATQMFSWRNDPEEQVDLSGDFPVTTGYLRLALHAMASIQAPVLTSEEADIDPELARRLRALGYLQ